MLVKIEFKNYNEQKFKEVTDAGFVLKKANGDVAEGNVPAIAFDHLCKIQDIVVEKIGGVKLPGYANPIIMPIEWQPIFHEQVQVPPPILGG